MRGHGVDPGRGPACSLFALQREAAACRRALGRGRIPGHVIACWDPALAVTVDFELVRPDFQSVRTLTDNTTNAKLHLSEGLPVTYHGPPAIGDIPAHVYQLGVGDDGIIEICDARSPFTKHCVTVDRLDYRMNYVSVTRSGERIECTIDTLHLVAALDGLKIVTSKKSGHLSHCPPCYWIIPRNSRDDASQVVRVFEPGQLWCQKPTALPGPKKKGLFCKGIRRKRAASPAVSDEPRARTGAGGYEDETGSTNGGSGRSSSSESTNGGSGRSSSSSLQSAPPARPVAPSNSVCHSVAPVQVRPQL